MSGVDGFVVFERIIANFSKFVTVEVGHELKRCAVGPVLSLPVLWATINLHCFQGWTVYLRIPITEVKYGVNGEESEVK